MNMLNRLLSRPNTWEQEITEERLHAEPVIVVTLPSRADVLGDYAHDSRITSWGINEACFSDGTSVARRSGYLVFKLFDQHGDQEPWASWTFLSHALEDILGNPRDPLIVDCPTCEGEKPAFGMCSDPECRSADIAYVTAYERGCES
jgi:hypothetical protein